MIEKTFKHEIYCAGPFFNEPKKNEMEKIANELEKSSYKTFLPHRDGLEYAVIQKYFHEMGISDSDTNSILLKAIFALDVFKVVYSDGLVLNMNGRVPDEGAMVEAGIAWATNKKIVIFKNDSRSIVNGNDNPLVVGLSNFTKVKYYEDIPKHFDILFRKEPKHINNITGMYQLNMTINIGKKISDHLNKYKGYEKLSKMLVYLFKN